MDRTPADDPSRAVRTPRPRRGPRTLRWVAPALLASLAGAARAQPAAPEDWPCVQVLVPEVLVETLWPAPIEPAVAASWREDPAVSALARRFAALEDGDEAARAAAEAELAAFVDAVAPDALETRLGALAAGTVALANERRAGYLDGIRRFTRQQIRIAERIEAALNARAEAEVGVGGAPIGADAIALARAGSGARRDEAEDALRWEERLYDQREAQVRALCERPVRLEEGLSRSLRAFAQALPAG